jgi:autotransporter-associated beta strand protein
MARLGNRGSGRGTGRLGKESNTMNTNSKPTPLSAKADAWVPLWWLAGALAVCLAVLAQSASATTYDVFPVATPKPSWPSAAQWQVIPGLVTSATTLTGDKMRLDFVGNATYPTAYYAADASYVYFRVRINTNDCQPNYWNDNLTVFIDNNNDKVPDHAFAWDTKGTKDYATEHNLELGIPAAASVVTASSDWNHVHMDDRDGTSASKAHPDFDTLPGHTTDGYLRMVGGQAGPNGANTATFVDFAVEWSYLTGTDTVNSTAISSLAPGQTWRVQFGSMDTGTDHANVNGDVAGSAVLTTTLNTAGAWSDPITPGNGTYTWTGGGSDANWSNGANWDAGTAPVNGADIVFPAGPSSKSPINDIASGTLSTINSITITDSGYDITSSSGSTLSITNGFINSSASGVSNWRIKLSLGGAQTFSTTTASASTAFYGTWELNSYLLTVSGSGDMDNTAVISGTGGITKSGGGTLVLSGANNYSGATTVSTGKFVVNASAAAGSAVTVASLATLAGTGTVNGSVGVNGTNAPGDNNMVGTLTTGAETWNGGGGYRIEINDATGTAGTAPGWDLLDITGTLTVAATSGSKFTIKVVSLSGVDAGACANFDNKQAYAWRIATASGGVSGFDTNAFAIDASGFVNSLGAVGTFSLAKSGNSVYLKFTPVFASAAGFARAWGTFARISVADLLTHTTGNDTRALVSVAAGSLGTTNLVSGGMILVAPTHNATETYQYVVQLTGYATSLATNTLTLSVTNAVGAQRPIINTSGGALTVTFFGIPGFIYKVQKTTSLSPADWVNFATSQTADSTTGKLEVTDTVANEASAYYRLVQDNN